ncbi:hypothetical protein HanRHA438_Chr17g0841241 [Helianthus annuus]|nr:hypothetical protein HanIR_Chr17g0902201 [Helianthus annuus]KAJ0828793.1 hypothetical protein HanRHA438_Chr17g0841241 [Helianthus annuus]
MQILIKPFCVKSQAENDCKSSYEGETPHARKIWIGVVWEFCSKAMKKGAFAGWMRGFGVLFGWWCFHSECF